MESRIERVHRLALELAEYGYRNGYEVVDFIGACCYYIAVFIAFNRLGKAEMDDLFDRIIEISKKIKIDKTRYSIV